MISKTPSIETVVVTGANGFIASHVVSQLLSVGYRVIGTIRNESKAAQIHQVHGNHNKLSIIVVRDITDADEIIRAVDSQLGPEEPLTAIQHLAAPFAYNVDDYERDLLKPAVQGTEAIVKVGQHFKSRGLRKLIHTNSFACIYDAAAGPCPEKTYTAADWSPLTYEDGLKASNAPEAYRAAKAVAEKTARSLLEHEQEIDLISLCPAMVFGPFLKGAEPDSIAELNESNKLVWDVVNKGEEADVPATKAPVWVDVRDVAQAHVLAVSESQLAGKRLLLAAGVYCNQEIADECRSACPKYASRIPKGQPGIRQAEKHFKVDSSEEAKLLGIEWRTLQGALKDLLPQLYAMEQRKGS